MATVSQRLLAELLHEDNVDGVLYHQDAVVLKGSTADDTRNFTGSLLLIQKRPVGAKRFLKGIAFPQPNYLVWLPYSYLYCLASHLLSQNARKAIDAEQDLAGLTAFTTRLRQAMIDYDENPALLLSNTQQQQHGNNGVATIQSSSSSSASPTMVIEEGPPRLDWQHSICIPLSHIHKMIRKSNIRGRRVLTIVRKEAMAMEAPLIFEEGGMSKLFDELKKVCQVDIRAGDEAFISREVITSSVPFDDDDHGDETATAASKHMSTSNRQAAGEHQQKSRAAEATTDVDFRNGSLGRVSSPPGASVGGGRQGGGGESFDVVDSAAIHEKIYGAGGGGSSPSGGGDLSGGGLLNSGFKSKATAAAERERERERERGEGGPKEKSGGFMSTMLSIGATFARGTAKAANALIPEDDPITADLYSRIEYNSSSGKQQKHQQQDHASRARGNSSRTFSSSTPTPNTESDFDFADDSTTSAPSFANNNSSNSGARDRGVASDSPSPQSHFVIHGDGSVRKHQEPQAPVLKMPLNSRKLAPPLGRIDWRGAFENNVNSIRLTSSSSSTPNPSPSTPRAGQASAGGVGGSSNTNNNTNERGGVSAAAAPPPSFPTLLPTSSSQRNFLSSPAGAGGPEGAQQKHPQSATNNPNLIARELAYGGTGTLRDEETFRKLRVKAFNGTISDDIRPQVWAYLLGVFPVGSTPSERRSIMEEHEAEYATLSNQWRSIFPQQEARFGAYREHKIAVEKDVMRTDRNHPAFKDDDSIKLQQLRNVLMAYAMYNFDLGYCQGMSDVLAVLLLIYPDDEVMCYAVFKHLLSNKMEGNFRTEMKRNIEVHLKEVQLLISRFSPALYKHLVSVGAEHMTFTFRWLLILFKREFDIKNVIKLWDVIFSSPYTPHFEALIAAAILHNVGHQIIEQQLAYDEILKFANLMTGQFDVNDVIMVSQDFYSHVTQQLSTVMRRSRAGSTGPTIGGGEGGGVDNNEAGSGGGGTTASSSGGNTPSSASSTVSSSHSSAYGGGGGGTRPRGASTSFSVYASMLGGGATNSGLIVGDSAAATTSSSAGATNNNINSGGAGTNNASVRPTLPEIIAFLEMEERAVTKAKW